MLNYYLTKIMIITKHKINKRILILCEDEKSSLFYFKSFRNDEKFRRNLSAVSIEVYHPKNFSPLGLVKDAIKRQLKAKENSIPYDDIWVVFDKDTHKRIPEAYNLAENNSDKIKINIAISIICFEFWVLLHYDKIIRPFHNCDELIHYIKINYLPKYEKHSNCFDDLKEKMDCAIINGKYVEKAVSDDLSRGTKVYNLSAYTNIHHLVEKLIKL
jgi:hypothetical protein